MLFYMVMHRSLWKTKAKRQTTLNISECFIVQLENRYSLSPFSKVLVYGHAQIPVEKQSQKADDIKH